MEEENPKRNFLRRFLIEEVNKLLESHWRQVIAWRTGTPKEIADIPHDPHEGFIPWDGKRERIWTDVFAVTSKKPKEEKKKLHYLCLVPQHRVFWEIILAFYVLFFPETYPNEREVARSLLDFFVKMKYSPEGVVNFKPQHYKFLHQLRDGERKLLYLENPIEIWVSLFCVIWANANEKATQEEELWEKQIEELVEKKCQEIEEDPENPIRKWEDEWKELNKSE